MGLDTGSGSLGSAGTRAGAKAVVKGQKAALQPWEEKDGAVMVIDTAPVSSVCKESPWGWRLCVQDRGVGWSRDVQLGLAEPQVSSLHCF